MFGVLNAENGLVALLVLVCALRVSQTIAARNLSCHLGQPRLQLFQLFVHRQHAKAAGQHLRRAATAALIDQAAMQVLG